MPKVTLRVIGKRPWSGDDNGSVERELRLVSDADTVPVARRFVASELYDVLPPDVVADAELVVSELVTNAILHAGTDIVVRLRIEPPTVRIEVEDLSQVTPVRPIASAQSMTGRGLALVEGLAAELGVDRTPGGKVVWCVLPAIAGHRAAGLVVDHRMANDLVETIIDNWDTAHGHLPDPVFTVSLGDVPTDLLLAAKEHMDNLGREFALAASGASTGETAEMPADMAIMVDTVLNRFSGPRHAIKIQALAAASRGEKRTTLTLSLPLSAVSAAEAYLRALDQADAYARSARILTLETPPQHRAFRRWYVETIIEQLKFAATGGVPKIQETFEQHLLREVDTVSAAQAQAEALASRLAHLQQLTSELTAVTTPGEIADIMVGHAADAFGARFAALYVRDGEVLQTIRARGNEADRNTWTRVPLDAELPICEAFRANTTVIVRGAPEIGRRYPALTVGPLDDVSVACMPLSIGDRCIGVVALTFPLYRDLDDPDELAFLSSLADACAQALDRSRALSQLQETAAKLQFLSEASAELAASLRASTTLANVAQIAVPRLADWCSIQVVDGNELQSVGLAHIDPAKVDLARAWQQMYPTDLEDDNGVARVIRTGKPRAHPGDHRRDDHRGSAEPRTAEDPARALAEQRDGGAPDRPQEHVRRDRVDVRRVGPALRRGRPGPGDRACQSCRDRRRPRSPVRPAERSAGADHADRRDRPARDPGARARAGRSDPPRRCLRQRRERGARRR